MIFILLPAYNEAENIRGLLEDIAQHAPDWELPLPVDGFEQEMFPVMALVVDDGSQDKTAEAARAFKGQIEVVVLQHEKNRGLAAALKTGLDYIAGHASDYDYIITMDADRTHSPEYISKLLKELENRKDVVVASRYAPGGQEHGVNGIRLFLSRGAKFCYHWFFPDIPLNDFSCGFRGFRAKVLKEVLNHWGEKIFQTRGFTCTGEIMLKTLAFTSPERVCEIPFELHYERKGGVSKMPAITTTLSTVWMLLKAKSWMRQGNKD